jgi:hypothetical protein
VPADVYEITVSYECVRDTDVSVRRYHQRLLHPLQSHKQSLRKHLKSHVVVIGGNKRAEPVVAADV